MGEYTREMHEQFRKAQDEKAARVEAERRERSEKEGARRQWLADGGSAGDFEREWPSLRNQARRQRVIDADRRARDTMQSSGVSAI
jgi:hypothetical protein